MLLRRRTGNTTNVTERVFRATSARVRECVRLKWNYSPHDTRTDGPNATTLSFYYNQ